jgi:hypothetical protein
VRTLGERADNGRDLAALALNGSLLNRALSGRDMAALALNGSQHMALEDYETGLVDALTNLMHFARRYDIDLSTALAEACRHYEHESRFEWDQVPE